MKTLLAVLLFATLALSQDQSEAARAAKQASLSAAAAFFKPPK